MGIAGQIREDQLDQELPFKRRDGFSGQCQAVPQSQAFLSLMGRGGPGIPGAGTVRRSCISSTLGICNGGIACSVRCISANGERGFHLPADRFHRKRSTIPFRNQSCLCSAVSFALIQEQIRGFIGHIAAADDRLPEIPGILHLSVRIGSPDQQRICRNRQGIITGERNPDIGQDRPESTRPGLLQDAVGSVCQSRSLVRGQREFQDRGIAVFTADGFFQRRQIPVGSVPAGSLFHEELYHTQVSLAGRETAVGDGLAGIIKTAVPSGEIYRQAPGTRHVGGPGQKDAFAGLIQEIRLVRIQITEGGGQVGDIGQITACFPAFGLADAEEPGPVPACADIAVTAVPQIFHDRLYKRIQGVGHPVQPVQIDRGQRQVRMVQGGYVLIIISPAAAHSAVGKGRRGGSSIQNVQETVIPAAGGFHFFRSDHAGGIIAPQNGILHRSHHVGVKADPVQAGMAFENRMIHGFPHFRKQKAVAPVQFIRAKAPDRAASGPPEQQAVMAGGKAFGAVIDKGGQCPRVPHIGGAGCFGNDPVIGISGQVQDTIPVSGYTGLPGAAAAGHEYHIGGVKINACLLHFPDILRSRARSAFQAGTIHVDHHSIILFGSPAAVSRTAFRVCDLHFRIALSVPAFQEPGIRGIRCPVFRLFRGFRWRFFDSRSG